MTQPGSEGQAGGEAEAGGASAEAGGEQQQEQPYWLDGAEPELADWVRGKGFKDPVTALKSHRALERLHGVPADQLLRLPATDDAEGQAAMWQRLGRPETAEGYQLPDRDLPEGAVDLRQQLLPKAFEAGLTQSQVQTLDGHLTELAVEAHQQQQQAYADRAKAADESLRRQWGQAYDQNLKVADRGAAVLGLDQEQMNAISRALGPEWTVNWLYQHGARVNEGDYVDEDNLEPGFSLSPGGAKAKLEELKGKHAAALADKKHPDHARVHAEEVRLFKLAYPE